MPQPGQVMPARLREMLNLTAEQRTQLDELQKDVDAKLAKILTDDQKKQLEQLRERGPRQGFGGGGGGRGPGGPGQGPGGGGPGPQRAGGPEGGL
jgi:Spy/CpxP family protein refolding chaperone